MRVCRVTERTVPFIGGKEFHVDELSRRQAADGHGVTLVYRLGKPDIANATAIRVTTPLPMSIRGGVLGDGIFCAASAGVLRSVHRRSPFDVLHLHGDFPEAFLGTWASRRLGIPSVLSVHGSLAPRWVGVLAQKISSLDAVVVVSDDIREQLTNAGAPSESIYVQSSGIDVDKIRAADGSVSAARFAERRLLIVGVGSLDAVKGFDVLIDAVRRTRSLQQSAVLAIAGDGPERAKLIRRAGQNVLFLGPLPRQEVWRWLAAADVVAIPSRRLKQKGEGIPTVLLEALAARRRIVATTTGGIPEVLCENVGGVLADPDDTDAFAKALLTAISKGPLNTSERQAADALVAARDWSKVVGRVTEILLDVADRRRSTRRPRQTGRG